MMRRIIFIYFLFVSLLSSASHIVGGEIYYDYLGNNDYRFYIAMYRDCNSTGAAFDNPLHLAVYNENNVLVQNVNVFFPGSVPVPVNFTNPCVSPPNNICTETTLYTTVINLPPTPNGYNVSYQRCCRGPNVVNLIAPEDTGFTLTCHVPGTQNNHFQNSSPRFLNYPPLAICRNEDLIFDHSATDPDGDQLVYSLVTPYHGGSSPNNVAPNPAAPPNYFNVQWAAGFSTASPLGPGGNISINPVTGILTANPNMLGLYVVGIQVEEIRNGVVINRTVRDFLFSVIACEYQIEAILPTQEDLPDFISYCQGLTINFVNQSIGGTDYYWDFGVNGITSDISDNFEPSYTYPENGNYEVMMVVNPYWPCSDTVIMDVFVNNVLDVTFTSNDSLCVLDNSFNFSGFTSGPPSTTFDWEFGPNANVASGSGANVNNISFSESGYIPVTINANYLSCNNSYTDSVYIFDVPTASMILPEQVECEGYTLNFGNDSEDAYNYLWDFGVTSGNTDMSADEEPTFTFPTGGNYAITLIASSTPSCRDTIIEEVVINQELSIEFTSQDSLCLTNNSFDFNGTASGPPTSVYTWSFGPNASIQSSNDIDVSDVSFNTTGPIPITLTGTFNNCIESVTHDIYLYREPTIDFNLEEGLQCAPFLAYFTDQSWAETGISYHWSFGDGMTSNEQNPSHIYENPGFYDVTLTIETTSGCINQLSMLQQDIINVKPTPQAAFTLTPTHTDICNSTVEFFNESNGASSYLYIFDDSTFQSTIANPVHTYLKDGLHRPKLIVSNEYQCKDSTVREVYIEPYTVYVPNSFTPDGHEFNTIFNPIVALGVDKWKIMIYNRWGETVFESHDLYEGWDGTGADGRIVQDGIYIWKIEYTSCEPINPEHIETGFVNLMK